LLTQQGRGAARKSLVEKDLHRRSVRKIFDAVLDRSGRIEERLAEGFVVQPRVVLAQFVAVFVLRQVLEYQT
jgi:hypothetical protein